jgi:hypothetical protein
MTITLTTKIELNGNKMVDVRIVDHEKIVYEKSFLNKNLSNKNMINLTKKEFENKKITLMSL